MTIVTAAYRYKPPPKRKRPVELAVPAIVTIRDKKRVAQAEQAAEPAIGSEDAPSGNITPRSEAKLVSSISRVSEQPDRKPAIVTIDRKTRRRVSNRFDTSEEAKATTTDHPSASTSGDPSIQSDDPTELPQRKSAIVTIRRTSRYSNVPELAPEEVRRRGDAADAMFQDFKRLIAEKLR